MDISLPGFGALRQPGAARPGPGQGEGLPGDADAYPDEYAQERPPFRICFVCSGNICRSPMAEYVLRRLADEAGVGAELEIDSAGTGDWHIGERADRRTLTALAAVGYDGAAHRARQFDSKWFTQLDLVIALDRGHELTLRSWAADPEQQASIWLLRRFDPAAGPSPAGSELDVPDPYYDGPQAFASVLRLVERCCAGLLLHLQQLGVLEPRELVEPGDLV